MYLDLLLLILILSFGIIGFIQGFLHQLLSILVILGIVLAADPLSNWLKTSPSSLWAHDVPVFILWSFCALLILSIGWALRFAILRHVRKGPLQATDRWFGLGLGLLKGLIVAIIASLFFQILPPSVKNNLAEINQDLRESRIVGTSANLLDWSMISSLEKLKTLKYKFEKSERPVIIRPWVDDIDRD